MTSKVSEKSAVCVKLQPIASLPGDIHGQIVGYLNDDHRSLARYSCICRGMPKITEIMSFVLPEVSQLSVKIGASGGRVSNYLFFDWRVQQLQGKGKPPALLSTLAKTTNIAHLKIVAEEVAELVRKGVWDTKITNKFRQLFLCTQIAPVIMHPMLLFSALQKPQKLKEVTLVADAALEHYNDELLEAIADKCPNLERLTLVGTHITDKSIVSLLDRCRNLLHVSLGDLEITAISIKAIVECPNVIQLGLSTTRALTNENLELIASGGQKLRALTLIEPLGELSTQRIIEMLLASPNLEHLALNDFGHSVTDEVLRVVKTLKRLKWFSCSGCKVTPKGVGEFFRDAPPLLESFKCEEMVLPSSIVRGRVNAVRWA